MHLQLPPYVGSFAYVGVRSPCDTVALHEGSGAERCTYVPLLATFDLTERKNHPSWNHTRAAAPAAPFSRNGRPTAQEFWTPSKILFWLNLPGLLEDEPENILQRILFVIDADDAWLIGASR